MKTVPNVIPARRPRVVVADDSTVAREGIAAIVAGELGYALCGLATDQGTTSELVEKHQPDLLVIEPFFGHHDGIFIVKQLATRSPIDSSRRQLLIWRPNCGRSFSRQQGDD